MSSKDKAIQKFQELEALVKSVFPTFRICILRCDNAPEYIAGPFRTYADEIGLQYEQTIPESPQQNGVSERHNLTIMAMARAMLLDADLSNFFWPLAVSASVHIKNRMPHSALAGHISPHEALFGTKPSIAHLRPFGSPVTSRILHNSLNKLDPRGEPGRFVGYPANAKGYLIWFPHSRQVLARRDVIFHNMPETSLETPDLEVSRMWDDIFSRHSIIEEREIEHSNISEPLRSETRSRETYVQY